MKSQSVLLMYTVINIIIMRTKLVIGAVLGLFVLSTWLLGHIYGELLTAYEQMPALQDLEYSWIFRLLLNLLGYSTVILPLYGLYKYLEKTNYFDKISNNDRLSRWLRALFCEHERLPEGAGPGAGCGAGGAAVGAGDARARDGLEFAFCFTGLMGAYLVWGLLQEKIMTQDYVMSDGSVARFTDSQFLVFINRLLGFLIALARLLATRRPVLGAPLYKFSYCALSNVVSAWCQYEALKFVSFPTQVLSKSCKVIPVMLMGKLISRCKYETYEYATAALISVGMALFLFGVRDEAPGGGFGDAGGGSAGASGAALLALYLACDGFTSSWQGALFRRHSLRPLQMLCCVSLCSCGLTAAALARRPAPALVAHPAFLADAALLAASSAAGQLLIYRTIARFGPALFAMAMTARQACSVLLSCAVYGHRVPGPAAGGALLVLAAVLLRLHCRRPDRRAA